MFDFLKELNACELVTLRDYLNKMQFLDVSQYAFGYVNRRELIETYENVDLEGYSRIETIDYSESLLIDLQTKKDAFTGEVLEKKWGGRDNDGFLGGWDTVTFFNSDSLIDITRKYNIQCQPFYSINELEKLFNVYKEFFKHYSWIIGCEDNKVKLPHRQYEMVDGKVKALRPLQFKRIFSSEKNR